jgi:hypothetical protein
MDSYVNDIIPYFVEVLTSIHIGIIFFKSLAKLFEFSLDNKSKKSQVFGPKKIYGKRKFLGTLVHVKNALHENVLFKFYVVFIWIFSFF